MMSLTELEREALGAIADGLAGSDPRLAFQFCRSQGVVPLLEVDDLDQARAELVRDGAELLGRPESDGAWAWLTFRCGCYAVTGRGSRRCSGPDVHGIMSPVK